MRVLLSKDVTIKKPVLNLNLKGDLEIQYDKNITEITKVDITARNLEELIHRLLDKITEINIGKLHEILIFLTEKTR